MIRRRPLSLAYEDQAPLLAALLAPGDRTIEPPDSDRFVLAALHHRLAGQANEAVGEEKLSLPPAAAGEIETAATMAVLRSALLRKELAGVVPAVADACGSAPLLLKGPAIADRYYPDPRLRPFVDIDLLVPRNRLASAVEALRSSGYAAMEEFRPGFAERHGHDVHAVRWIGAHQADVEVHWRIGDDPLGEALDHARITAWAEWIEVAGSEVAVPDTPHQLVATALHLLSDRAKRLVWVEDVKLMATAADDAQWQAAFEVASVTGLGWVIHRALDYAERHLGLSRSRPAPAPPPPAWGPLRAVEELDMRASTHVGRLVTLDWRDRGRYLRDVIVPTRDGLRGTVGQDGAPTWRLALRHLGRTVAGLAPRRN